jgi:signal peptidase I
MTQAHATHGPAGLRRWFQRDLPTLLLMLLLLGLARTSFANHYVVPSGSMEPTLMPGDRVVVDMSAYGLRVPFTTLTLVERGAPRRGDVVLLKSPADGKRLIKRVVAVAGDRVDLDDGRLSINGVALALDHDPTLEHFAARAVRLNLDDGGGPDIGGLEIPSGKLLVLGDHRGDSADGRAFGLVADSAPYARAIAVYYRRDRGLAWLSL